MADKISISSEEIIANRNNWLKIFVIVIVTIVSAVKIWNADFNQVFSGFDFSDLLSLFLAIFSITLAVLFYFKATDTSNVFYDNTYRFTKDVSEMLGRIESGFGERLKHLDEGYTGLKTAVENIPFDKEKAQKEIQEEEEQVEKVENERKQLIESLANRAKLQETEKSNLFDELKKQDKELNSARRELDLMRRKMYEDDNVMDYNIGKFESIKGVLKFIVSRYEDYDLSLDSSSSDIINQQFSSIKEGMTNETLNKLLSLGVINNNAELTVVGIAIIKSVYYREMINSN